MIEVKIAEPGDSDKLALRPEDQAEANPNWRTAVEAEIAKGHALSCWAGSTLVAMFGIAMAPDLLGPWLLCSDHIERHKRHVMRRARVWVQRLHDWQNAPTVGNYIGKQAHSNRKFVQALGFLIIPSPSGAHDFFYLPRAHV
jgi:hypothetical protein